MRILFNIAVCFLILTVMEVVLALLGLTPSYSATMIIIFFTSIAMATLDILEGFHE